MAERRCLSRAIITSDAYISLSHAARTLYVYLLVTTDDDGFSNIASAFRLTETGNKELNELEKAGFVIPFPSGIVAIRHFWVSNTLRRDRHKPTIHTAEYAKLVKTENGIYENTDGNQLATNWQPPVAVKEIKINNNIYPSDEGKEKSQTDEGFTRFWAAYPRNEGKKDAQKAFRKIAPNEELLEKMLGAIEWQKKSKQWQDGFTPHASTWLNGERWNDEMPTTAERKPVHVRNDF